MAPSTGHASGRYRVIRLIEIEYPSFEAYEQDSQHWALPTYGVRKFGPGSAIYRCSTTPVSVIEMDDE